MGTAPNAHDHENPSPSATGQPPGETTRPGEPLASDASVNPAAPAASETTHFCPGPTAAISSGSASGTPAAPDPEATQYYAPGAGQQERPRLGRFGDYELLEEIARGGMGVVYKARQTSLDRLVALKMILAGRFAAPGALERFRLEARAAAALNHPGIVPVYEISEVEGQPYFTMAFVAGGSLQQLLDQGPLLPLAAARLLQQVAQAVQCAHDRGIIHRDIKPQNILLHRDEGAPARGADAPMGSGAVSSEATGPAVTPLLTDFGLARAAAEGGGLTKTGEVMGTPSFMPPEQAVGNLKAIGARTDVYSLGAVLYCMLTGQPPFQSPDPHETMRQVREDEPVAPRRLNPMVPRDLETVCLKCLAKNPLERYASAGQLMEDLDCVLADQPLRYARRASQVSRALGRLGRSVRRRPVRTAYIALSLAAFAVLGVILLTYVIDRPKQLDRLRDEARAEEEAAEKAKEEASRYDALAHYALAVAKYGQLVATYPDRSEPHIWRAHVYTQRGILLVGLRELDAAEKEFLLARDELMSLAETHPANTDRLLELAEVFHNLGILYDARARGGDLWTALTFYGEALKIRTGLWKSDDSNARFRRDLARSYGYMADTQLVLGLEEAKTSYDEAEKLRQSLVDDDTGGNNLEARYQLARSKGNTGIYWDWMGQPEKAINAHVRRKQYLEGLPQRAVPADFITDLADCYISIAQLQLDRDSPPEEESLELLEKAREVYEPLLLKAGQQGKQDKSLVASLAQIHANLGKYHLLRGDPDAARPHLGKALHLLEKQVLKGGPGLPSDRYHLALVNALLSQLDGSAEDRIANKQFALKRLEEAVDQGYMNVARLERDAGFRPFRQENRFQDAVKAIKEKRGPARQQEVK